MPGMAQKKDLTTGTSNTTRHRIEFSDSRTLSTVANGSVDLVVTSPPYPMIEMWDSLFTALNPDIADSLQRNDGYQAFELMNRELDTIWEEIERVVKENGFVCINIGDATRKIGNQFQLYSNHSRITSKFVSLGFQPLPIVLWKKTTNAPNKFMGSGCCLRVPILHLNMNIFLYFGRAAKESLLHQIKEVLEIRVHIFGRSVIFGFLIPGL